MKEGTAMNGFRSVYFSLLAPDSQKVTTGCDDTELQTRSGNLG